MADLPANVYDRILDPTSHGTSDTPEAALWNRLFFMPGRPLQSAELNEVQTFILNALNRLGRTLFVEGSRISGVEVIQKPLNRVQVTDGVMFIDDRPRDVPGTPTLPVQQDLQLTGEGREFVGILRTEIIRRPESDISLFDPVIAPTVGAQQFNRKGALRQIYKYDWLVVNDQNPNPSVLPIFEFRDGNLITTQSQGQFTEILRVLARRTFDEEGHYLVSGFAVNIAQDPEDVDKLIVRVDAGKAYVLGYEILKTSPSIFTIEKAVTVEAVNNESFIFIATPTPTFLYALASRPVKRVTALAGKVTRSWTSNGNGIRVTRSTTENFDDLFSPTDVSPDITPEGATRGVAIYQILKISNTQGTPQSPANAHYVINTDYVLDGNKIVWISGNKPGPGQSYYVDLILIRILTKGRRRRVVVANEPVVHSALNSVDTLLHKDLIRVTRVANTTNPNDPAFVEGRDYLVNTGRLATTIVFGSIDWSLSGVGTAEPNATNTYYVSYEYWEHLPGQEGDYISRDCFYDTDNETPAAQYVETYKFGPNDLNRENMVDFRCIGADLPVNNLSVTVDYEFFVPRRDAISLNSNGEFVIHKGIPARYPVFPQVVVSTLHIANLDLPPNSPQVLVTYPETRRLTKGDLWQIRDMLDVQVYNAAVRTLESLAMFEFTPGSKKMILVDPFIDFSRQDIQYSRTGITFKASIDPEDGSMGLPQLYGTRLLKTFSGQHTTANFKKIVMTEYSPGILIDQSFATEKVQLNPYTILDPVVSISLSPNEWPFPDLVATPDYRPDARIDSLIPLTQADLREGSTRVTRTFGLVRRMINRFWVGGSKVVQWGGAGQLNQATNIYYPSVLVLSQPSDYIVSSRSMDRIDLRILDKSVVPKAPQIRITVASDNWYPFGDNIKVYFDGVQVPATAGAPAYVGTLAGTLRADSQGRFTGSILVPADTATGRREIRCTGLVPATVDRVLSASAIYANEGLRQVLNTSFVSLAVVNNSQSNPVNAVNPPVRTSPIAQNFRSNRNVWITGVVLYFGKRPNPGGSGDRPLLVQIRDVEQDGSPGVNILAQKSIRASDVTVALDSSQPSSITFDDPVFIQDDGEYVLVLETEATDYQVFLSRLGSNDLITKQLVVQNSSLGTLWRSSGGKDWSPDSYAQLKMRMQIAEFNPTVKSVMVFKNIPNMSTNQLLHNSDNEVNIPSDPSNGTLLPNKYTKFLHVASYFAPPGSRILWYYSINGGVTWSSYTPGIEVNMGIVPTDLQIKCEFDMQQITGIEGNRLTVASAAINLDHNALILIANEAVGYAVTKNVNLAQPANTLRVIFLTNVPKTNAGPADETLTLKYSVDDGFTWYPLTGLTERVILEPWREWRYDMLLPQFSQVRIRVDITNSSDFSADPILRLFRVIAY